MDNLTHSLTGVLLSRAGLNRLTPRATLLGVVAANIPDIDIVAAFDSAISYLNYHRHLTHSFPAVPFMAALALVLVEGPLRLLRPRAKKAPWGRAYAAAFAAALSHPLLDTLNTYGIRLWLPFSDAWQSLDVFFIIEPWLWGLLLICTLGPWLARLVHREIGAPEGSGRVLAVAGLMSLVLFAAGKLLLHDRAVSALDAHLYDRAPALRTAAFPDPRDPWSWQGYVETGRYYLISDLNLRRAYRPREGRKYYKPEEDKALAAARKSEVARDYLEFARYAFARVEKSGAITVRYADFRFGRGGDYGFTCTVVLDEAYRVLEERFSFGSP